MQEQRVKPQPLFLTSSQHWMIEESEVYSRTWNMAFLLAVPPSAAPDHLEQAILSLLEQHDALCLRLVRTEDTIQALMVDPGQSLPLLTVDISTMSDEERERLIQATADGLSSELGQFRGQLLRYAYFQAGAGQPGKLLWVISHFITDAFSNEIVFQDLQHFYQQIEQGMTARLTYKMMSFKEWSHYHAAYVQSEALKAELETYWLRLPWEKALPLPLDHPEQRDQNTLASSQSIVQALSVKDTTHLLKRQSFLKLPLLDLLLAALMESLANWTPLSALHVCVIDSGRLGLFPDVDLYHTVGFTALGGRLLLSRDQNASLLETLRGVAAQIRTVPRKGIGLDCLGFASDDEQIHAQLEHIPACEMEFNYLGQMSQQATGPAWFHPTSESIKVKQNAGALRRCLFYWNVGIMNGQLIANCDYSDHLHDRSTVEALIKNYLKTLRDV